MQNTMASLKAKVITDAEAGMCLALGSCFRGHVKLETRAGWKRVDEITVDDFVLARDEFNPHGELVWKRVEAIFRRTGRILEIVAEGKEIGTTPEHPFDLRLEADNSEWTEAGALHAGDEIRTKDGWVKIDETRDTGLYETVYNIRVADFHTYFVGDEDWGFAVWAHNANPNCQGTTALSQSEKPATVSRNSGPDFHVKYYGVPTDTDSKAGPNTYRITEISGPITETDRDIPGPTSASAQKRYGAYLLSYINNPAKLSPSSTQDAQGIPVASYEAGHLIPATLGGPNSTLNLVLQTLLLNQGAYKLMGLWVLKVLQGNVAPLQGEQPSKPSTAKMTVVVSYDSGTSAQTLGRFIPTGFQVTVTFNGHDIPFSFTQNTTSAMISLPNYWD